MPKSADMLGCSSKEQAMERLRSHMRAQTEGKSQSLALRMDECGVRWGGDYECQSPACLCCRRRYIGREQNVAQQWFGHHDNSNLAMVSVVLEASSDVSGIGDAIVRSRDANRNRFKACRRKSSIWDGVYLAGWHEVDAVGSDQIVLLPPQRRALVEQIAPWSLSGGGPAWLTTYHGIVHLNGLAPQDVASEFSRQWPLDRQVRVQGFNVEHPVIANVNRIVSYAHKFTSMVKLTGGIAEPWPVSWQSGFFGWLHGAQRNAFEALRFTVGPKQPARLVPTDSDDWEAPEVRRNEREPLPCSFTGVHHQYSYAGRLQ